MNDEYLKWCQNHRINFYTLDFILLDEFNYRLLFNSDEINGNNSYALLQDIDNDILIKDNNKILGNCFYVHDLILELKYNCNLKHQ